MGTERRPVRAAIAARNRDQGRIRAVTAAIGAASIVAGGAVAYVLPGTASAQASSASHGQAGQHSTSRGTSSSGSGSSGSATHKSSSARHSSSSSRASGNGSTATA